MPRPSSSNANSGELPTMADYIEAFADAPLSRKAVLGLSSMLARVVGAEMRSQLSPAEIQVGRRTFGGSKRRHHLDTFVHERERGLLFGIDVKGLNSGQSVGKNWNNRIGDLHELASNHHSNFPSSVLGGVLAIPLEGITSATLANIERAMMNLQGRRATSGSLNQLEGACLLVISKEKREIHPSIPDPDGPLRLESFVTGMTNVFKERWS